MAVDQERRDRRCLTIPAVIARARTSGLGGTLAPLVAYDDQYETELVGTVEAYLENDGNVAQTASRLFTHRHTIRYRLERVRELGGHDITSSEGREKLSLGLKAMRVLGIAPPRGPATEPGTEGGQVPRPLLR